MSLTPQKHYNGNIWSCKSDKMKEVSSWNGVSEMGSESYRTHLKFHLQNKDVKIFHNAQKK